MVLAELLAFAAFAFALTLLFGCAFALGFPEDVEEDEEEVEDVLSVSLFCCSASGSTAESFSSGASSILLTVPGSSSPARYTR